MRVFHKVRGVDDRPNVVDHVQRGVGEVADEREDLVLFGELVTELVIDDRLDRAPKVHLHIADNPLQHEGDAQVHGAAEEGSFFLLVVVVAITLNIFSVPPAFVEMDNVFHDLVVHDGGLRQGEVVDDVHAGVEVVVGDCSSKIEFSRMNASDEVTKIFQGRYHEVPPCDVRVVL